jgi:hypothetical protein
VIDTIWVAGEKVAEFEAKGWRISETDRERPAHRARVAAVTEPGL